MPPRGIPTYTPRETDGRGWSTQAIDQPRPLPSSLWKWKDIDREKGTCAWADAALLDAFNYDGELDGNGKFCSISIDNGQAAVQIGQEGFWEPFDGPAVEQLAFMRSIEIERLQAREYSLQSGADALPGSCTVEVNTRSLNHITVLAARENETDPAPMCQKARDVATLIVKRFIPLAGGKPWPNTPQQPRQGVLGVAPKSGPCEIFAGPITYAFLDNVTEQPGQDGSVTTCIWSRGEVRGSARLTLGAPPNWRTLPPLGDNDISADTKLGVMPALIQMRNDGTECAETVEYAPGETLHFAYLNPDNSTFTAAELCRIAENVLGDVLGAWADITGR